MGVNSQSCTRMVSPNIYDARVKWKLLFTATVRFTQQTRVKTKVIFNAISVQCDYQITIQ